MPFEGQDGPLDVNFYDPVPTEMIANDDLDLQVLWACILDKMDTPRVDRNVLGQAWVDHVQFPWDEYGLAIRNLRLGIKPPTSGCYDNYFTNGMGAAIRSELWACLAPGNPDLAGKYAYEDACVDHAGDGIWAAVFLASLESLAFVETDPDKLLAGAVAQLPETSLVRRAVGDTRRWWLECKDCSAVRERILTRYGHENFTDVTMNMAFTVLGWLAGDGDFSRAICIATNCGKDTDCTAATVGALMGILNPEGIDQKWLDPIGNDLVVSPEIVGICPPATLEGFTDLVLSLKDRVQPPQDNQAQTQPQDTSAYRIRVDRAFVNFRTFQSMVAADSCEFPETYTQVYLSGALASLPAEDFADDVMLLRYRLELDETTDLRLVFNTPQCCRVWVDGRFCFARDGGCMAPSPHRAPENQFADMILQANGHEIVAAVVRPDEATQAEWIIVAADGKTHQWLAEAFLASG
jgi:ADP-ribosylglycohydrolase